MAGQASKAPMIGGVFGHYLIEERLGEGAFGVVYRARDIRLNRPVAVKVLNRRGQDKEAWGRVLLEARAGSALNHPSICAIYDAGEDGDSSFIAMEYVEGETLQELLRRGPLPGHTALAYGLQIASALDHAHRRGIVHRDLKSSNVMITADARAKLLDFGLAGRLAGDEIERVTHSRESLASLGGMAGTLPYVSPEILRGKPAGAQSDLWALGALLYEMLAGELPFKGRTPFELSMAIMVDPLPALPPDTAPGLRRIVERCLEKDPGKRYGEASETLRDLEAEPAGTVRAGAPRAGAPDRPRLVSSRLAVIGASMATVVALGIALAWQMNRRLALPLPPPAPAPVTAPAVASSESQVVRASKPAPGARPQPRHPLAGNPNVQVWVNTKSKIYHCPGTRWYQKTRDGVSMPQKKARAAGFRPASGKACP